MRMFMGGTPLVGLKGGDSGHRLAQAEGTHVGPDAFDVIEAGLFVAFDADAFPAVRDGFVVGPDGVLFFVVYDDFIS